MLEINEKSMIDNYLQLIDNNKITFLKNKSIYKDRIKENFLKLKNTDILNDKVEIAKIIWKDLFETSLTFIDSNKKGYDKLYSYFEHYIEFEELIFASDSFYRDHTIHCIWVYLMSEFFVKKEEYSFLFGNLHNKNSKTTTLYQLFSHLNKDNKFNTLCNDLKQFVELNEYSDSIICLIALTHDLGYPLKKIKHINDCIKGILPFFSINNFDEFDFTFNGIQMNYIDTYIELLSTNVYTWFIKKDSDSKEEYYKIMTKLYQSEADAFVPKYNNLEEINLSPKELSVLKNTVSISYEFNINLSKKLGYCKDFENYQHGIMSGFLLMKTIDCFNSIKCITNKDSNIRTDNLDYKNFDTKLTILKAISDHTNNAFRIKDFKTYSSILTFIDELEEFSRISRAKQNRQYINEFCKTQIGIDADTLIIKFIFDNEKILNINPEIFFKSKCKRLLSLFSISSMNETIKLKIECIDKRNYSSYSNYILEISKKYVNILVNDNEVNIPLYLDSNEYYTKEEYALL